MHQCANAISKLHLLSKTKYESKYILLTSNIIHTWIWNIKQQQHCLLLYGFTFHWSEFLAAFSRVTWFTVTEFFLITDTVLADSMSTVPTTLKLTLGSCGPRVTLAPFDRSLYPVNVLKSFVTFAVHAVGTYASSLRRGATHITWRACVLWGVSV